MTDSGNVTRMPKRPPVNRSPFALHIVELRNRMGWTQEDAASQPAWLQARSIEAARAHLAAIEACRRRPSKEVIDMLVDLYAGLPGASYEILMPLSRNGGELSQPEQGDAEVIRLTRRVSSVSQEAEPAPFAPMPGAPEERGVVSFFEQTLVDAEGGFVLGAQVIGTQPAPVPLFAPGRLFAVVMRGMMMFPAITDGTLLYVDRSWPPTGGGHCLITLKGADAGADPVSYIREFVSDDGAKIVVRHYGDSPGFVTYPTTAVESVQRILSRNEEKGIP